jgi:hypothetical protein
MEHHPGRRGVMAAFKIEYNDGSYWVFADILPNTPWAGFLTREVAERFIEQFVADLDALNRIYAKVEAWVKILLEELRVNRQAVVERLGAT